MKKYTREDKIKAMKELRNLYPYRSYGIDKNGDLMCCSESVTGYIVPNYIIALYK